MIQWVKNKVDWVNVFLLSVLCTMPSISQAATVESILKATTRYLTGGLAKAVGGLAIVGTGYLTLYAQKFPKEYFMMVLLGLGIIFGGSTLYNQLVV